MQIVSLRDNLYKMSNLFFFFFFFLGGGGGGGGEGGGRNKKNQELISLICYLEKHTSKYRLLNNLPSLSKR